VASFAATRSLIEGVKFMKPFFRQIKVRFYAFALFHVLFLLAGSADAQTQVANFSTGKVGTKSYENFSFGVEDGVRGNITYTYGRNRHEIKLNYAGRDTLNGIAVFKVEFPNNEVFYVIPQRTYLKIVNKKGTYNKVFRWSYEGPVNGIGTFCEPCTQDGKESVALIRKYFF
jgi:hypothetical protein